MEYLPHILIAYGVAYIVGLRVFPIQKYKPLKPWQAGTNTAFKAYTDPERAQYPRATQAQEVYEARAKYRLIDLIRKSRYERQIEGAEITVQAAFAWEGVGRTHHRLDKAEAFMRGKRNLLPKGHKIIDIERDMRAFSDEAARWVRKNAHKVDRP